MSFGPNPWQQQHWDWRAAGNFIGGGAGSGLVVASALAGPEGPAFVWPWLAGLALIGLGLLCVWAEIGRPLRALNVFVNPRTSWMSREAMAATLLFPVALAALWLPPLRGVALLLALVFLYCQARIVGAARGIPAWREPALVPLLVCSGLCEGLGLLLLARPDRGITPALVLGVLVLLRMALWARYRWRLGAATGDGAARTSALSEPANRALDSAGRWLQLLGTLVPLLLIGAVWTAAAAPAEGPALLALAGLAAALPGAGFKFLLITRAGFNQGFALRRLPVRGVPRG